MASAVKPPIAPPAGSHPIVLAESSSRSSSSPSSSSGCGAGVGPGDGAGGVGPVVVSGGGAGPGVGDGPGAGVGPVVVSGAGEYEPLEEDAGLVVALVTVSVAAPAGGVPPFGVAVVTASAGAGSGWLPVSASTFDPVRESTASPPPDAFRPPSLSMNPSETLNRTSNTKAMSITIALCSFIFEPPQRSAFQESSAPLPEISLRDVNKEAVPPGPDRARQANVTLGMWRGAVPAGARARAPTARAEQRDSVEAARIPPAKGAGPGARSTAVPAVKLSPACSPMAGWMQSRPSCRCRSPSRL